MRRTLGRSSIGISAMGLGCWAIGGTFYLDGKADGYGDVADRRFGTAVPRWSWRPWRFR